MRYRISHLAPVKVGFGRPVRSDGKEVEETMKEVVKEIENLLE